MADSDDTTTSDADDGETSTDTPAETSYRRRIGVTLAVLALLGAWIAVVQTNAATNESRTTRQATRLASESQTADVVEKGVLAGLEQIDAEIEQLPSRPAFGIVPAEAEDAGAVLDPGLAEQRLETAESEVASSLDADAERVTEVSERAARLSLEQSAVVEERITWNARASQYETVMTTLAVAIFLIGFTMVVGRKLRPPFAAPGLALAVFCLGWAVHIYLKPIPDVDRSAIGASAAGQVAIERGRPDDAVEHFTEAVDIDGDYYVAQRGLGLSRLVAANPDLLRTLAVTDDSVEVITSVAEPLRRAIDLGGEDDPTTLTIASTAAVVAGDWDLSAELLERAIEVNARTPGLQLARSAVAIAQGDEDAAQAWLDDGVAGTRELIATDTDRKLAAQYLSQLELVAEREPDQADLADEFRDRAIALIAEARAEVAGQPLDDPVGEGAEDATLEIVEASFDDGRTTIQLAGSGVSDDARVVLAGYERPAPGAAWVQPPELFYAGPPDGGRRLTFDTPRACVPVEYRFDLYVNGVLADSTTAPGGEPTC